MAENNWLSAWRRQVAARTTATPTTRLKSKHLVIAAFVGVTLLAMIGFALYGRGLGAESCDCTSPTQAGFNAAGVVFTLIVIMGFIVLSMRPDVFVGA